MRGRKPIPQELHDQRGSYDKDPQRRPEQAPEPIVGVPECPEYLIGHAREEWDRMVEVLGHMRLANRSDCAALEIYCRAYADWRHACEQVARLGQVIFTKRNGEAIVRRNPFDVVREKNAALCLKLLAEFGLTPSSRVRCQVNPPPERENVFLKFLQNRPTLGMENEN